MTMNRQSKNAVAVLLGLLAAACAAGGVAEEGAPEVTVSGKIAAEDGGAVSGCRLELYDTAALKPALSRDVPQTFSVKIRAKALLEKFYFRTRCDGYRMAARSKIFDADDLSRADYAIDLAAIVVGQGAVTVTGEVLAAGGASPKACTLGLYTGFHSEPVRSWDVAGGFSVTFDREDVDNHFRFEVSCQGYAGAYKSPTRPESWLDESGGEIPLGKITLR
jgi:hypothetical protein